MLPKLDADVPSGVSRQTAEHKSRGLLGHTQCCGIQIQVFQRSRIFRLQNVASLLLTHSPH